MLGALFLVLGIKNPNSGSWSIVKNAYFRHKSNSIHLSRFTREFWRVEIVSIFNTITFCVAYFIQLHHFPDKNDRGAQCMEIKCKFCCANANIPRWIISFTFFFVLFSSARTSTEHTCSTHANSRTKRANDDDFKYIKHFVLHILLANEIKCEHFQSTLNY